MSCVLLACNSAHLSTAGAVFSHSQSLQWCLMFRTVSCLVGFFGGEGRGKVYGWGGIFFPNLCERKT